MKRWRRGLCCVLALLLCVTAIPGTPALAEGLESMAVVTGEKGINLMDNPGFEEGFNNWGRQETLVLENADIAYTHSGAKSAKVSAGAAGEAYAYCNTTATYDRNAAFTAGMWVYLSDPADAEKVTVYLERPESNTVTAKPAAQAGWQKVTLNGDATTGATRHAIKFTVSDGNIGDIYFDDAFLYCGDAESVNLIRNEGFEDASKSGWAAEAFEITAEAFHGGASGAKITGAKDLYQASGWWPNKASADAGVTLYFSAWVKGGENAGTVKLRAEVKNGQTFQYASEETTVGDWTRLAVAIPASETRVEELLFHIDTTGEGVFYVDDVCVNAVEPKTEQPETPSQSTEDRTPGAVVTGEKGINLMDNPGFEDDFGSWGREENLTQLNTDTAYTHSGAKSAKVSAGVAGEAYAYCNTTATYDRNAAFTAGMWVYLSDPADAEKVTIHLERPESNTVTAKPTAQVGWQKVTLNGDATTGAVRHAIKFTVSAETVGDIYFDDAFLYCGDAESVNLIRNEGFEDTGKSGWATDAFEISSDVFHGGASGAKITGEKDLYQASGWWPNKASANTGETLYFSAWVMSGENAGALKLRAEVKCDSQQDQNLWMETEINGTDGQWVQLVLAIPAQEARVSELLLHINTWGSGVFYVDDVRLNAVDPTREPEEELPKSQESRTPGAVVTGLDGINLMDNPGFESNKENWGMGSGVSVNTNTDFTHSGTGSVKVEKALTEEAYGFCTTSAVYNRNAAVIAGAWVFLSKAEDAEKVTIWLERPDSPDGAVSAKPTAQVGWQRVSLTGGETTGATAHTLKFTVAPGAAGDVYFDDAFLFCEDAESINLIRNNGFEDGANTWAGTFENAAGVARTGDFCAKITGGENLFQGSAWWPNKASANPNLTLYYSAWVKGGENAGTLRLRAEVKSGETKDYYSEFVTGETADWQLLVVAIPCEGVSVQEILFHITASGQGVFYVDDARVNAVKPEIVETPPTEPAFESKILRNASLEDLNPDGTITHWDIWPGNPAEGVRKFQIVSDAHSGARAVRIDLHEGNNQAIYQYCVDPNAFDFGGSYVASVWMRLEDVNTSLLSLTVKRRDSNGTEHNISQAIPTANTDGWVRFTVEAPKVKGVTIVQYDVVVDIGTGSGKVYLDDFDLVEAELEQEEPGLPGSGILRNPSLETLNPDGSVLDWDVWPGNPAEGVRKYEVVTDGAHSGSRALKILPVSTNSHAVYQYCTDKTRFDFNGSYVASVWVKLENVNVSVLTIGVKRKDAGGREYNVYNTIRQGSTNGWVQVQLQVPGLIGTTITQFDVIVDIGAGSGAVYLDDFDLQSANLEKQTIRQPLITNSILRNPSLETLNPDGSVLDWDVWPGNPDEGTRDYVVTADAHSGDHAIRVNLVFSNAQAVYQYCVDPTRFDFNGDYVVSAWVKMDKVSVYDGSGVTLGVKRTDSLGNVHVTRTDIPLGTSDGWFPVSFEVPAFSGVEIVQYDVIVDMGAGSGSVYLDDFDLVPADLEDLPNPNEAEEEPPKEDGNLVVTPEPEPDDPTTVPETTQPAPQKAPTGGNSALWIVVAVIAAVGVIGGGILLILLPLRKKKK